MNSDNDNNNEEQFFSIPNNFIFGVANAIIVVFEERDPEDPEENLYRASISFLLMNESDDDDTDASIEEREDSFPRITLDSSIVTDNKYIAAKVAANLCAALFGSVNLTTLIFSEKYNKETRKLEQITEELKLVDADFCIDSEEFWEPLHQSCSELRGNALFEVESASETLKKKVDFFFDRDAALKQWEIDHMRLSGKNDTKM